MKWCGLRQIPAWRAKEREIMKIMLLHVETGQFLRSSNQWTANPDEAYDWQHSKRLLDYVKERGLEGMEIGVKFPGCDSVEVYPLKAAVPVAV